MREERCRNVSTDFDPMNTQIQRPWPRVMPILRGALFVLLFIGGFAMVFVADFADKVESQGLQILSGLGLVKAVALVIGGLAALYLLVRHAEITLALFFL